MSIRKDGDNCLNPPFQNILTMDDKQKELLCYFDLLQQKLDDSTEETKIQMNISKWLYSNTPQFTYKPTMNEMEKWITEAEQKTKIQNTIGIVCWVPCKINTK